MGCLLFAVFQLHSAARRQTYALRVGILGNVPKGLKGGNVFLKQQDSWRGILRSSVETNLAGFQPERTCIPVLSQGSTP